jgi:hypothetical protein
LWEIAIEFVAILPPFAPLRAEISIY